MKKKNLIKLVIVLFIGYGLGNYIIDTDSPHNIIISIVICYIVGHILQKV